MGAGRQRNLECRRMCSGCGDRHATVPAEPGSTVHRSLDRAQAFELLLPLEFSNPWITWFCILQLLVWYHGHCDSRLHTECNRYLQRTVVTRLNSGKLLTLGSNPCSMSGFVDDKGWTRPLKVIQIYHVVAEIYHSMASNLAQSAACLEHKQPSQGLTSGTP